MPVWLQILSVLTAWSLGVGGVVWKVALPFLREQIARPAQQAAHSVTVNSHSSDVPTVRDDLSDIKKTQKEQLDLLTAHLIEAAKDHERLAAAERDLGRHDGRLIRLENKGV
ncbi:MAG TPA: hypothetical protein VJL80_09795 [Aeromicrobium sp.]|nr:hypothetical protein [Aeromicrobium sp.]HKY58318.1 hypothetical protein [Aeromicrobium sp.]